MDGSIRVRREENKVVAKKIPPSSPPCYYLEKSLECSFCVLIVLEGGFILPVSLVKVESEAFLVWLLEADIAGGTAPVNV